MQTTRLTPPADLSPAAKVIFVNVVTNSREGHFQIVDVPLLVVYCEAVEQARSCAKLIRRERQRTCAAYGAAADRRLRAPVLADSQKNTNEVYKDLLSASNV